MKRDSSLAVLIGLALLGWWWYRGKMTAQAGVPSTPRGTGMIDTVLDKILPNFSGNPLADGNPAETLIGLEIAAEKIVGPAVKPPPTHWYWTGGLDPNKLVTKREFETFDKSKCTDKYGVQAPCDTQGYYCTQGIDCP